MIGFIILGALPSILSCVLLVKFRRSENKCRQLKKTLNTARGLIVRHHAADAVAEWGTYCKVCHRADGTEPELDEIADALNLNT